MTVKDQGKAPSPEAPKIETSELKLITQKDLRTLVDSKKYDSNEIIYFHVDYQNEDDPYTTLKEISFLMS
jgi:hypothetical protein